jgi:hypothetical protein
MGLVLGKKWPCLFLAAFLIFAIMGLFTVTAAEPLRSVGLWGDESTSGGSVIQQDLGTDTPVEGEPVISNARGYSFSPLRNGGLRTFMLTGMLKNDSFVLAQSSLKAGEKAQYLNLKNTILLKLRI